MAFRYSSDYMDFFVKKRLGKSLSLQQYPARNKRKTEALQRMKEKNKK